MARLAAVFEPGAPDTAQILGGGPVNAGRNLHAWRRCDPHTCLICLGQWVEPVEPEDE